MGQAALIFDFNNRRQLTCVGSNPTKLCKNGTGKRSGGNKKEGKPSTVYPIKDAEQLGKFIAHFREQIDNANTDYKQFIAARNYLLVIVGLNTAYRISDILLLKWGDIFDQDKEYTEEIRKTEKKTSKKHKYRTVFLEKQVKEAIDLYLSIVYKEKEIDLSQYIFTTCKSGRMGETNAGVFIKKVAEKVGIKENINTHSLRKTFVYHSLMNHRNDAMFLTKIQNLLGHNSSFVTLKYAGITNNENREIYRDIGDFYQSVIEAHDEGRLCQ